jgi:hypothetical protein
LHAAVNGALQGLVDRSVEWSDSGADISIDHTTSAGARDRHQGTAPNIVDDSIMLDHRSSEVSPVSRRQLSRAAKGLARARVDCRASTLPVGFLVDEHSSAGNKFQWRQDLHAGLGWVPAVPRTPAVMYRSGH